MKIHDYYQHSAVQHISAAIAALLPVIILITYNLIVLQMPKMMILVLPFLIYSFSSFILFQFSRNKYINSFKDVIKLDLKNHDLMQCSLFLTAKAEDIGEKIILFHPDGSSLGELKRKEEGLFFRMQRSFLLGNVTLEYVLTDYLKNVRSFYLFDRKKRKIDVLNAKREHLGSFIWFNRVGSETYGQFSNSNGEYLASFNSAWLFNDARITIQQAVVAKYQTGRLSPQLQKRFASCQIPVLEINQGLNETEKLLFLALLLDVRN